MLLRGCSASWRWSAVPRGSSSGPWSPAPSLADNTSAAPPSAGSSPRWRSSPKPTFRCSENSSLHQKFQQSDALNFEREWDLLHHLSLVPFVPFVLLLLLLLLLLGL